MGQMTVRALGGQSFGVAPAMFGLRPGSAERLHDVAAYAERILIRGCNHVAGSERCADSQNKTGHKSHNQNVVFAPRGVVLCHFSTLLLLKV